jgi:hypothetical protein
MPRLPTIAANIADYIVNEIPRLCIGYLVSLSPGQMTHCGLVICPISPEMISGIYLNVAAGIVKTKVYGMFNALLFTGPRPVLFFREL